MRSASRRVAQQVKVVVDEAWDDRATSCVDRLRGRTGELCDVLARTDRDDAVTRDGDRLRNGEALVHRDDFGVGEDEIWCLSRSARTLRAGRRVHQLERAGDAERRNSDRKQSCHWASHVR